jgi:hypothetical protein
MAMLHKPGAKLHALLVAFAMLGCSTPSANKEEGPVQVLMDDTGADVDASLYQMPTPNELFDMVHEMAGEGQRRLLNSSANADRYATRGRRALNFGVYATDLIYASYFKLNVEVVRYYLTAKKLGERLGINSAFNDHDFGRLERNIINNLGDSIETISNEAYYRAYENLQRDEMGPTLVLVLAGGWVETMHLVMAQVDSFVYDDPLITRVAEQKFTLEHLVDVMQPFAQEPDVAPILADLVRLRAIYDQVEVRRTANQGRSSSGRLLLGDDVEVDLTPEQYAQLVLSMRALRANVTRPEDRNSVSPI